MTRERTSFTFDIRRILLSVDIGFSFVTAAMASSAYGFEPSSETVTPRYLKLVTVPAFCTLTAISLVGTGAVCH